MTGQAERSTKKKQPLRSKARGWNSPNEQANVGTLEAEPSWTSWKTKALEAEPSWTPCTWTNFDILGPSGGQCGPTWTNFGQFGPTWGQLGFNLGSTWPNMGQHGANMKPTWDSLGANLGYLEPTWANLGPIESSLSRHDPARAHLGPTGSQHGFANH